MRFENLPEHSKRFARRGTVLTLHVLVVTTCTGFRGLGGTAKLGGRRGVSGLLHPRLDRQRLHQHVQGYLAHKKTPPPLGPP